VTLPKARNKDGIKSKIVYTGPLAAPIEKGAHIADLKIFMEGAEKTIPLIASDSVEKLGFFGRIIPNLKALFTDHGSK
jgi:D-alanyl-D-alanine carboxypeptidase (penicillin-binding protein 5/6)